MSAVLSSARPNRSPRSFRAWLAFCTALVTLSAAECSILLPADERWEKRSKIDQRQAKKKSKVGHERGEKRQKGKEIRIPWVGRCGRPVVTNEPVTSDVRSLISDPEH